MSITEIPLAPARTSFVHEVELEGTTWRLLFRWNFRESAWYMSVFDLNGVNQAPGLKITAGSLLLGHHYDRTNLPPGDFMIIDPTDTVTTPDQEQLGSEAVLVYFEEEDLADTTVTPGTVTELGVLVVEAETRIATSAANTLSAATWAKVAGTFEDGILNGFAQEAGRLRYLGTETRTFLLSVSYTVECDTATRTVTTGVAKNGLDPVDAQTHDQYIATADQGYNGSVSFLVSLATNEYIELWGKASGAANVTWSRAVMTLIG